MERIGEDWRGGEWTGMERHGMAWNGLEGTPGRMKKLMLWFLNEYYRELNKHISRRQTLLDVGCGGESCLSKIVTKPLLSVGIEINKHEYLRALNSRTHDVLIRGDAIKTLVKMRSQNKFYDVVLLSDIVEHLCKEDGLLLIQLAERIAREKVIIYTPNGYMNQEEFLLWNPYQQHLSGWESGEFEEKGYEVKMLFEGVALFGIKKMKGD